MTTTSQQVAQWQAARLACMVRCPNNTTLTKEECVKQQAKAAQKPKWNNGQTSLNHCHGCDTYRNRGRI